MITVHILDDHKFLVEGLELLINESKEITVTGVSYSLETCRKALQQQLPDVLLLDLNLPDGSGIDFCGEIHQKEPQIKILVLTTRSEYSVAKQVMENGASGYILKNAKSEDIIAGIKAVMDDEVYLCAEIDTLLKKRTDQHVWLTSREKQLLKLMIDGYTNQEIADKMFLSVETIKSYRKNLILKLGAKNSILMVKMAMENCWV
jgi:DNA-binding NarL/FixJ family response regulator